MIDLTNKTILVIGASGLLGSHIALTLAQCGARVIPTYHKNLDGALGSKEQPGEGAILPPIYLNITNPDHIEDFSKVVGVINGLVFCSGLNLPSPFDRIKPMDWVKVLQVNLDGPFLVTQALLPHIRDGGSIVYLGSVSSALAGPTSTHYACSKSALVTLARNVALFAAPRGIRSNVVSPGYIQSPMAEHGQQSEAVRQKVAQIPLGRLGQPEDVSGVVAFLMSDLSRYVTGQEWGVNGGLAW